MKIIAKPKRRHYVTLIIFLLVCGGCFLCSSFDDHAIKDTRGAAYAGSLSCRSCHQAIYDSFVTTAHNLASSAASDGKLLGRWDSGFNHFRFNAMAEVVMTRENDGVYQTAYINGEVFRKEAMDIVIGSGRKGQTFLYWKDNALLQDPISFYTPEDIWCNSPGYPKNFPYYDRVATTRCMECHSSYAQVLNGTPSDKPDFDKSTILYGVDCERCHGPAKEHVDFQTAHPNEKTAAHILLSKDMSRQQKLDVCSLCHSGIRIEQKPPFSFVAGEKLTDYSLPRYNTDSVSSLDVHGNQYGLLSSSKCFRNSQMTCSSCHDVHAVQIDQPRMFSAKCMECHNQTTQKACTVKVKPGLVLSDNCIDCHMPRMPSKAIFLQMDNDQKSTADYVRSHKIAIYKKFSKAFLNHRNP